MKAIRHAISWSRTGQRVPLRKIWDKVMLPIVKALRLRSRIWLHLISHDGNVAWMIYISAHPAARLQSIMGFKSVIGSLWIIDDTMAHVVEAFYGEVVQVFEGR